MILKGRAARRRLQNFGGLDLGVITPGVPVESYNISLYKHRDLLVSKSKKASSEGGIRLWLSFVLCNLTLECDLSYELLFFYFHEIFLD